MKVYRIQDANNMGPMHYKSTIRQNVIYHKDPDEMQGFQNGKPVKPQITGSTGRFAWDSLESVYMFIKFPRAVDKAGYHVVVYEVDETKVIRYPDGQVLFYMEDATAVEQFLYSEVGAILHAKG